LEGQGLAKSRDGFQVLAAQLGNDAEVVIDERMLDSLPEGTVENFFRRFKITRLQRLYARGDLRLE
jgi:hypothetical protein